MVKYQLLGVSQMASGCMETKRLFAEQSNVVREYDAYLSVLYLALIGK